MVIFMEGRREALQVGTIRQRIQDAVDVSGAFDNCFFHSYAAYLLTNDLPLPNDLFIQNPQHPGCLSPGEQLKQIFNTSKDLEVFSVYHQKKYPAAPPSDMLVEKTMVLGVLLREWFAQQLLDNTDHKAELFDNNNEDKVSFLKMIEGCRALGLEHVIQDDRYKTIYEANLAFFDALSPEPQPNELEHFRTYWNQDGYKQYCQHLAKPGVKVSFTEVDPVLIEQKIPYVLYSKQDGSVTSKHEELLTSKPLFELSISANEGHYSLLKNSVNAPALEEYQVSMEQYKIDREVILRLEAGSEEKSRACESMPSQLLKAILPEGVVNDSPVDELILCAAKIKLAIPPQVSLEAVEDRQSTPLIEKSISPVAPEVVVPSVRRVDLIPSEQHREDSGASAEPALQVSPEAIQQTPLVEESSPSLPTKEASNSVLLERQRAEVDASNEALIPFEKKLYILIEKTCSFKGNSDENKAAHILIDQLLNAKEDLDAKKISIEQFKEACFDACDIAEKSVLNKHRGWKQVIANILSTVVSIATFGRVDLNWSHINTDTINKVQEMKKELTGLRTTMDTKGTQVEETSPPSLENGRSEDSSPKQP